MQRVLIVWYKVIFPTIMQNSVDSPSNLCHFHGTSLCSTLTSTGKWANEVICIYAYYLISLTIFARNRDSYLNVINWKFLTFATWISALDIPDTLKIFDFCNLDICSWHSCAKVKNFQLITFKYESRFLAKMVKLSISVGWLFRTQSISWTMLSKPEEWKLASHTTCLVTWEFESNV